MNHWINQMNDASTRWDRYLTAKDAFDSAKTTLRGEVGV
jgi:hypothetical protein